MYSPLLTARLDDGKPSVSSCLDAPWLESAAACLLCNDGVDCSGGVSKAFFLAASSLDIAVLRRSGKVEESLGRELGSSLDGASSDPKWALSAASIELDRDRDRRLELEKKDERRDDGRERDSSALTLDDLLELPNGCFLVSLRDSLRKAEASPVRSASSSLNSRFSNSSLSASKRFVARLSFFWTTWLTVSCLCRGPSGESFAVC
ncbi:hypothetical protein BJY01DRAFT_157446 [Aspergillus pseudoustus]|uniref:Uncharacterized protein n=1 Tax=Aspergillus pseudoustus TaxID=1810923 RepID=A0ABR4ICC8_9EURO